MASKYDQTAEQLLPLVGGKENVASLSHCMTRLRFTLKDDSAAKEEQIKTVPGVLGVVRSGGQLQVIIGTTVEEAYNALRAAGGFAAEQAVDENLDAPKPKVTPAYIGNRILDYLAGSLVPVIPILMGASIFKMVVAVFGPSMLNWLPEGSTTLTLFTFVGDAGFYFLPIYVGYTAARKVNLTPVMGMFMGAILIHPTFMAMATADPPANFNVFGIPTQGANYSSTILPILLSVWVMSYVEKFFKKYIPHTLRTVFAPFLTVLVMLPISLSVLAPLGGFVGSGISAALLAFTNLGGVGVVIAIALIGALWQFMVMSGMHIVLIATLILTMTENGHEGVVTPAAVASSMAVAGMALGMWLKLKNADEKALAGGFTIASFFGGVTEPALYGLGIRYRRPFIGLMTGGFAGGLYMGITGVTAYSIIPVASFISNAAFLGGPVASNFVNALIGSSIALVVATVVTYVTGLPKDGASKAATIDIEAAMAGN